MDRGGKRAGDVVATGCGREWWGRVAPAAAGRGGKSVATAAGSGLTCIWRRLPDFRDGRGASWFRSPPGDEPCAAEGGRELTRALCQKERRCPGAGHPLYGDAVLTLGERAYDFATRFDADS